MNIFDVPGETGDYFGVDVVLIAELLGEGDWIIVRMNLDSDGVLTVQLDHHFHYFAAHFGQLFAVFLFFVIDDVFDDAAAMI